MNKLHGKLKQSNQSTESITADHNHQTTKGLINFPLTPQNKLHVTTCDNLNVLTKKVNSNLHTSNFCLIEATLTCTKVAQARHTTLPFEVHMKHSTID